MKTQHAHSFQPHICDDPDCHLLHLLLLDEREIVFAECTLSIEQLKGLTEIAQDAAYAKAAHGKDY